MKQGATFLARVLSGIMLAVLAVSTAQAAQSIPVSIGFSTASMPYVDRATASGIEVELVTKALQRQGFMVRPVFIPHLRALAQVHDGKLDAYGPVGPFSNVAGLHVSDIYTTYTNIIVALDESGATINDLNDLIRHRVLAFHNARSFLGEAFRNMTLVNKRYEEIVDQGIQVESFFLRRDRIIILEERIFQFHQQRLAAYTPLPKVRIFRLFAPQERRFAFASPALRDAFNAGLASLRADGTHDTLFGIPAQ